MTRPKKTLSQNNIKLTTKSQPQTLKKEPVQVDHNILSMVSAKKSTQNIFDTPFAPYIPPKGVLPPNKTAQGLAMDWGFDCNNFGDQGFLLDGITGALRQGYSFPGFSLLSEWSQISEFRKPSEVLARELTRKWITFVSAADEDKQDKIDKIEAEFKRLNVQHIFRKAIQDEGLFGRSQIFLDMGQGVDDPNDPELKTELVESKIKIGKNSLKRLCVIEPLWSYPSRYNANNPLDPTFYRPISWYVLGKEIHSSRMLTLVTRPLPDILKPSYAFAGMSLSQLIKPYVDNWLRTRQSVSDLIHSYTVWVLSTDMSQLISNSGAQNFYNRLQLFNEARDNHGVNAVDKNTEEFGNVSASLAGLDKLQAQAQEHMSAPTGIPLVYMTGITPSGLNATSEGEIEVFQDTIASIQELITPHITKLLNIVQLSLFGEIDTSIDFEWEPLRVVSAREESEIRKMNTETDVGLIDAGVLSTLEVRTKLSKQEGSPYMGLDLDEEIIPPDEDNEAESFHLKSLGGNGAGE